MPELRLSDGGSMAYQDQGTGRPVIFLHGWAMRGGLFAEQAKRLAHAYRCLVPDLRGHGESSPLPSGQGVAALADDIAALIAHLALEGVVLCGWSMGAMVAWSLVERHGGARLAGLAIEDMTPRIPGAPDWAGGLKGGHSIAAARHAATAMRRHWRRSCPRLVSRIFATGRSPMPSHQAALAAASVADPESMAALWESLVAQDFRAFLPSLALPTLILFGSQSQLYGPQASAWLAENMPRAKAVAFPDAGHAPHLEEPDRFSHALAAFLAEIDETAPLARTEQERSKT
ncbi:MAG: alpha/beta hydrolase [Alphaproteobacteria bacterium]|nr:MAG: alpha/beta hydrolase [Alphaproteobacteria bacterium]